MVNFPLILTMTLILCVIMPNINVNISTAIPQFFLKPLS